MGFFGRRPCPEPPHPRREPRLEGELTAENLARVFENCVDYNRRSVAVGGNEALRCEIIFLAGMVRMERVSDYVLRPLAQDRELGRLGDPVPGPAGPRKVAGREAQRGHGGALGENEGKGGGPC